MTAEIGIATMNQAMIRVRYSRGEPGREIEGDAGKEAGFGGAEQQPQRRRSCSGPTASDIAADTSPQQIMMRDSQRRAPKR